MNKMQAAAEDVKKLAAFLSNLVSFADELEKIGSLQAYANELDGLVKSHKAQEEAARINCIKAKEALVEVEGKARLILAKADEEAALLLLKAKDHAEMIKKSSTKEASDLSIKLAEKKAVLEAQVEMLAKKKADVQEEVQSVQSVLGALKDELANLKAKLGV